MTELHKGGHKGDSHAEAGVCVPAWDPNERASCQPEGQLKIETVCFPHHVTKKRSKNLISSSWPTVVTGDHGPDCHGDVIETGGLGHLVSWRNKLNYPRNVETGLRDLWVSFWFCLGVCFCLLLGEEAGPNLLFLLLDETGKPCLGRQQLLITWLCTLKAIHTCLCQCCNHLHNASGCCVLRSSKRLVWPREPERFARALNRVESQKGSWYLQLWVFQSWSCYSHLF